MDVVQLIAEDQIGGNRWVQVGHTPRGGRLARGSMIIGLTERVNRPGSSTGVHEAGQGMRVYIRGHEFSLAGGPIKNGDYVTTGVGGLSVSVGRDPVNVYVAGIALDDAKEGDLFVVHIRPEWIGGTLWQFIKAMFRRKK